MPTKLNCIKCGTEIYGHYNLKYCKDCRTIVYRENSKRSTERLRNINPVEWDKKKKNYSKQYRAKNIDRIKAYRRSKRGKKTIKKWLEEHVDVRKRIVEKYNSKPETKRYRNKYYRENILMVNGKMYNVQTCDKNIKPWLAIMLYIRKNKKKIPLLKGKI